MPKAYMSKDKVFTIKVKLMAVNVFNGVRKNNLQNNFPEYFILCSLKIFCSNLFVFYLHYQRMFIFA
jgi:hypothetical protein